MKNKTKLKKLELRRHVNVSGQGTSWNLPNMRGLLYSASPQDTPFLSLIGGLNGGMESLQNEFPVSVEYANETAAQPAITETASLTAPAAIGVVRSQNVNSCQIVQKKISVSYENLANRGRLTGLNDASAATVQDEIRFQTEQALVQAAMDTEVSFLSGTYQKATDAGTAGKTRGMYELCASNSTVAAAGAALSTALIDELLIEMFNAGAKFRNVKVFVNGFQKVAITNLYKFVPMNVNQGGANIQTIITNFGTFEVILDRHNPAASIGFFDLSVCKPVFQTVPNKGQLFVEALAKTGASEDYQLFGKIGLDHGPGWMHGSITGLATA